MFSSITVLQKPLTQTFYQAVENFITLSGDDKANCLLVIDDPKSFLEYDNAHFITAIIQPQNMEKGKACHNSKASDFFLMDIMHQNHFALIHKGDGIIYSNSQKNQFWEQTITFY